MICGLDAMREAWLVFFALEVGGFGCGGEGVDDGVAALGDLADLLLHLADDAFYLIDEARKLLPPGAEGFFVLEERES